MTCLTVTEAAVDYAVDVGGSDNCPSSSDFHATEEHYLKDSTRPHHRQAFDPPHFIVHSPHQRRSCRGGLNHWLAEALDLVDIEILEPSALAAEGMEAGYGRIGRLASPDNLSRFAARVGEKLGIEIVRFVGPEDKPVRRVAVSCGSGSHLGRWLCSEVLMC